MQLGRRKAKTAQREESDAIRFSTAWIARNAPSWAIILAVLSQMYSSIRNASTASQIKGASNNLLSVLIMKFSSVSGVRA
jgi:hypothetical protein